MQQWSVSAGTRREKAGPARTRVVSFVAAKGHASTRCVRINRVFFSSGPPGRWNTLCTPMHTVLSYTADAPQPQRQAQQQNACRLTPWGPQCPAPQTRNGLQGVQSREQAKSGGDAVNACCSAADIATLLLYSRLVTGEHAAEATALHDARTLSVARRSAAMLSRGSALLFTPARRRVTPETRSARYA
jgi:hypothetical protein